MTPGTPAHRIDLTDDHEAAAKWMLERVDSSPDKLALITMPPMRDDQEIDDLEAWFITVYDIAKTERPDLSVKMMPAITSAAGDTVLVFVHEHHWVGGECLNACGQSID